MNTANTTNVPAAVRAFSEEAIAAFHDHLVRMFRMPPRLALARVNAELARNPLTCDIRLRARPKDGDVPALA